MRLIKLSANKSSFQTIVFKPGLNLIVGRKQNPSDKNVRNTYNGVGKSLTIYLIHFCLASNKMDVFDKKIPDWEFTLEFEIDGMIYTSTRNTSLQNDIFLNGKKKSLTEFRNDMLEKLFDSTSKRKNLTFNTLFPRFIRRDRECYSKYDTFVKKEQDYSKLINNAFLLSIDADSIEEKKKLRDEQKNAEELMRALDKDPVIKGYFNDQQDSEVEILDLDEDIQRLEEALKEFKIASNYNDIEKEADAFSFDLKKLENKRFLISKSIKNIEKSLKIEPDISNEAVVDLYNHAKVQIPEMVKKQVEEVLNFHKSLLSKRKQRLASELKQNREQLKIVSNEIEITGNRLDERLSYLHSHGALDEYTAINNRLNDLKAKRKRIGEHQNIIRTYRKKIREIQADFAIANKSTEEYLDSIQVHLETIMTTFRELSKSFYDNKSGSLKITNNEGANILRYDISAKIQDDSSDGVNEVKIFCFDMTLLLLQFNHKFKFIFHDSRLFSNMDPRQRYTLFKQAYKKSEEHNLQYIASINEDTLESFRDLMDEGEYEKIIDDSIILTLTDESEKTKLLGIQVDMDYEK